VNINYHVNHVLLPLIATASLVTALVYAPFALADETSVVDDSSSSAETQVNDEAVTNEISYANESPVVEADGWHAGALGAYYVRGGSRLASAWVVTAAAPDGGSPGLQRYWVGADGVVATSRLVAADEAGYWAYATPSGAVVRGRWADPSTGYVYLADNDGRLADPGWLVTAAFGGGLQRYWVDASARACVPGYSEAGWAHYTLASGRVLRGADSSGGSTRYADNDGRLASGWLVTAALGGGLQRYWVGAGGVVATSRLVDPASDGSGWWAYATPSGAVVRGRWADPSTGYVYLADNDGLLAGPGWAVRDCGDGLQRYWVDASARACVPGYSEAGWAHYTLASGCVVRGRWADPSTGLVYLADNDGLLAGPGWVVGNYGDGLQRYWVDASARACVPGRSTDGWAHYTLASGCVLRGAMPYDPDGVLLADNDGRLAECYSSGGWLVTAAFSGELQRYRIDDCCGGVLGAHAGAFEVGGSLYYGSPSAGYVARNDYVTIGNTTYYADNDGRLMSVIQYHNIEWAGQPNNFFCGPTSGYMILRNVGAWTSARGDGLSIENVATYMETRRYGFTSLQDRKFQQGMNDWLGDSIYTTIHTPSYAQVRSAVLSSYETGYATAVDAMERRGGPHYNGHNNGTFAHIMVVDGYNSQTDAVYLVDPGAGVLWPSGSQHFWYSSLQAFTTIYLQTEYYSDGKEHIGIYYAVK